MSPTLTNLTINATLDGRDAEFAEAVAAREQHWAGTAGKGGGDMRPESMMLGEVLEARLDLSHMDEADLRHAARTLRAKFPHDADMQTLASHLEGWEMFASEASEKEMVQMNATTESMTRRLIDGLGEAYREDMGRRWPANNSGKFHEPLGLPRTTAPLPYPDQTKPVDVDEDRAARGAREPSMSEKLRSLAMEVSRLARLSSNSRQRNRLTQRAEELQRMSLRQYQREMENDVSLSSDPDEPSNVMSKLAADMDDEARANGAQPDDVASYDDWSDRPGADQQINQDVRDQLLDEDLPRVPQPGRRAGEDQLGDPAAGTAEPKGRRKNVHDDNILQRLRRGTAPFGSGQPRGNDRFGGERSRYSAYGRESLRESGGDLTATLLNDLDLWYRSGLSWF